MKTDRRGFLGALAAVVLVPKLLPEEGTGYGIIAGFRKSTNYPLLRSNVYGSGDVRVMTEELLLKATEDLRRQPRDVYGIDLSSIYYQDRLGAWRRASHRRLRRQIAHAQGRRW